MALWPLTFEILFTFALSSALLYRYGNWAVQNVLVTVSVFVAWFFSFIVIFILPLDISTVSDKISVTSVHNKSVSRAQTAYRQCLTNHNFTQAVTNASHYWHLHDVPANVTPIPIENITTATNVTSTVAPIISSTIAPIPTPEEICQVPWAYAP